MKKCPYCVGDIDDVAIKCRHCGSDLSTPEAFLKSQALKTKLANDEMRRANELRIAKEREAAAKKEAERLSMLSLPGMEEKLEWYGKSYTLEQLIKIDALKFNEAREYLNVLRARSRRKNVWVICALVVLLFWVSGFRITGLSFVLIALWLLPRTGEEIFINRIKRIKEFKVRAIASFFLLFFAVFDVYAVAWKVFSEKPAITVLSSTGTISWTWYELRISAIGADSVSVNWKPMDKSQDGSYSSFVKMPYPTAEINILASNLYYESKHGFVINRVKTDEEIRIEKEADAARAAQLEADKKAAAERLIAEQNAARKMAEDNKKKEAKRAELQKKYEKIAKNGYVYEVQQTLSKLWFVQLDSKFETAPDWSTQVAQYYQRMDGDFAVKIRLQNSYALWQHFYSVVIE